MVMFCRCCCCCLILQSIICCLTFLDLRNFWLMYVYVFKVFDFNKYTVCTNLKYLWQSWNDQRTVPFGEFWNDANNYIYLFNVVGNLLERTHLMPLSNILLSCPTYTAILAGMATLQAWICCKEMYFGHLSNNQTDTEWESLRILNLNIRSFQLMFYCYLCYGIKH